MKVRIFKISILVFSLFVIESCQKNEWEEIQLNDNSCGNVFGILGTVSNYSGTIDMLPETGTTIFFVIAEEPKTSQKINFIACNLPEIYHQKGLKIIFSGEVLNLKDWVDGNVAGDFIGNPIRLTTAKIKK